MSKTNVTLTLEIDRKTGPFLTDEQLLKWVWECLNCNANHATVEVRMAPEPVVIAYRDEGRIDEVLASAPVRMIVLDSDLEGVDEAEITEVEGSDVAAQIFNVAVNAERVEAIIADVNDLLD